MECGFKNRPRVELDAPMDVNRTSLKIALVCDHFLPQIGGIELHVEALARQLKMSGHRPRIITSMPGNDIEGIEVFRIKTSRLPAAGIICNPMALAQLREILCQGSFDLIHFHSSIASPLAYGGMWVCRKLKIPTVLTVHSLFSYGSIATFRALGRFFPGRGWPLVLTAVSTEAARRLKKAFPEHPVFTLHNGVDATAWRTERRLSPIPRIAAVMRLHRKKRPHHLLKALPRLNERLKGIRPFLSFVGDGKMRRQLESMAMKLGVADQVEFKGWLPAVQIKEVLAASDLFVLPSPWESLGITALEACGAGVPVVAMARSGAQDIVEPGRNGFLADNFEEMVDCIHRILTDPGLKTRMSENARTVGDRFDWGAVIQQHLEIYQRALALQVPATANASSELCKAETSLL